MIFGECPYCEATIENHMPDVTPVAYKNTCDECNNEYWIYASRLGPVAYTKDGFEKEFVVDPVNKTITPKESGEK